MATSALEIMMKNLSEASGASVEFKKQLPNGTMVDTTEKQLSYLKTQSKIASTAQLLQKLDETDRTKWAIEMKDYANELYENKYFPEALEVYVEALTASKFVDEDICNTNVEDLIIPVLCNMAACCIQLKHWEKAAKFAEQAIKLRSNCSKALMRQGVAFFYLGEFKLSISTLKNALDNSRQANNLLIEESKEKSPYFTKFVLLSENDIQRITIMISKSRNGLKIEKKGYQNQKTALQKIFSKSTSDEKSEHEINSFSVSEKTVNSESLNSVSSVKSADDHVAAVSDTNVPHPMYHTIYAVYFTLSILFAVFYALT